jgi:hypothetical protein
MIRIIPSCFPSVTNAWWHVWASQAGAVGPSGVAGPGGSAGPSSWPRCRLPVVYLHDPTCRDDFGVLGAGAWDYTWCEPEWWHKVGSGVPLCTVVPTLFGPMPQNCSLILILQIKPQHNLWNRVST